MRAGVANNKWSVESTTWPAVWWPRVGDERLARLAARGNPRAFATVYERYHQVLYRYCRSILRDDADAQDALQSTFTRALSALKRDQRSAPLRPWLFRIAHNEAISVLRRRGRGEEPLADATAPSTASAEEQAGERARMAALLGDLAALPDRARSALVMRELGGLSHEEIAIALDTTPGATKQAIFEARRGLLECAEGRAMPCAEICQAISDGDRRSLRGRRVRAHLRDCASCAAFAASIEARQADLRALVPALPAAASVAVLARAMPGAVGHAGGGGAAVAAGAAGKTVGVAFTSKGFATASLLATAAVSVGGVAAVVRLAPDSTRLFKAPGGSPAHVRAAKHPGSTGHAHTVRLAGSRAGASSVGSSPSATHTGAASRAVHFGASNGHGRAIGRHQAKFGGHRQFGHWTQGHGGEGWDRGWSATHHHAGTVAGVRHDGIESYAGVRVHHAGRHLGSAHRASPSVPHSSHSSSSVPHGEQHGRQVGHKPRLSPGRQRAK
ncbi:MAG TPA: RNA polymerase sigma factor [Solirubrobacteraceae bacterium]|nr:RNA polymerase sigma factor [Solirubrobacteraceae bacterium]